MGPQDRGPSERGFFVVTDTCMFVPSGRAVALAPVCP